MNAAQLVASTPVWPITLTGWVTLVGLLAGLLMYFWAAAKFIAKLNGFGARLDVVEHEQTTARAERATQERMNDRVVAAQESLLEKLGEARRGAEGCESTMQDFAIEIGSKIDTLQREMHADARLTGERLKAIETELFLTRKIVPHA